MSELRTTERRVVDSWRLKNLKELLKAIDADEEKARISLSKAIAKTAPDKTWSGVKDQLGRILSGTGTLGEKWLGYIETAARQLARDNVVDRRFARDFALDFPPEPPSVVYVLAAVNVCAWGEMLSAFQEMKEVVEAGLVYGDSDMDAMIKLRAPLPEMHDAILRISAHPHVRRTQSLQSVPFSRTQRKQGDEFADPERVIATMRSNRESPSIADSAMDVANVRDKVVREKDYIYPSTKIRELFESEIASKVDGLQDVLSNHQLSIKLAALLTRFPVDIVNSAQMQISAVVIWKHQPRGECERARRYLEEQAKRIRISDGEFVVKRTFVLPDSYEIIGDGELCYRIVREMNSGIDVRLLESGKWPKERLGEQPSDFGLMDDQLFWEVDQTVNAEGMRIVSVSLQAYKINRAGKQFLAIWNEAQEISGDLKRRLKSVAANITPPDCETRSSSF